MESNGPHLHEMGFKSALIRNHCNHVLRGFVQGDDGHPVMNQVIFAKVLRETCPLEVFKTMWEEEMDQMMEEIREMTRKHGADHFISAPLGFECFVVTENDTSYELGMRMRLSVPAPLAARMSAASEERMTPKQPTPGEKPH